MAMSSSNSYRYRRAPRESSSSLWSEWEWDIEKNRWQSHRINSRGAIEWKFESQLPSSSSAVAHIPRLGVVSPMDTVSEDTSQYSSNQGYITSNNNIGVVTNSLAPATLGSRSNPDPPIVARLQQNNTSIQHRNFDHNYRVQNGREFKFGKVFKVLWSEPTGSTAGGGGGTVLSYREVHGEAVYAKVRRFVIIYPRQGHCLCLPIMSYEGRATSKPGVHPEEHAIIYTTPEPRLVSNEDGSKMIFDPVKMIPDSSRHALDEASRINYAKIYTVEYNVKVWFIGHVDQACEQIVRKSYNNANQPLPLLSQPSIPTSHTMNNPSYDNSSYTVPGTSSNTAGYSYGNQMPTLTPSYGAASANSNPYGSSQHSAPSYTQPLYFQPQYPPQYSQQYPPSQYSTLQHQPYMNSTSQGYDYDPQDTYEPSSGGGQQ